MKTSKTEVRPFRIDLLCEECEIPMNPGQNTLMSHPPQFQYSCPSCAREQITFGLFPHYVYETVIRVPGVVEDVEKF